VAFCTTNRNRTPHLKETLPQNLADNPEGLFVVLNYSTQDDLLDYLITNHRAEIGSGQLVCYTYPDAPKFRMAHAKNMAHRLGLREGAEILVNLDADNLTGRDFDTFVSREFDHLEGIFLYARMIKGKMTRGVNGRIAVDQDAFLRSGGYDERKFDGWGSDDKDLYLRLRALGLDGIEIPPSYLLAVAHNDRMRFREYPELSEQSEDFFAVDRSTIARGPVNNGSVGCGTVYCNFDFTTPIHLEPLPTEKLRPARVFGIGMHKTATTSLHNALASLGYESWHWSSAHAAKSIWREMNQRGRSATLEAYDAASDLPIPLLFRELDRAYPGSRFILTLRDERNWLHAVMRHFSVSYNKYRAGWNQDPFTNRVHQITYGRRDFEPDVFLARYRRHNEEVLDYFRNRPNDLLIMNMDRGGGWQELCGFLQVPVPDVPYPYINGVLPRGNRDEQASSAPPPSYTASPAQAPGASQTACEPSPASPASS